MAHHLRDLPVHVELADAVPVMKLTDFVPCRLFRLLAWLRPRNQRSAQKQQHKQRSHGGVLSMPGNRSLGPSPEDSSRRARFRIGKSGKIAAADRGAEKKIARAAGDFTASRRRRKAAIFKGKRRRLRAHKTNCREKCWNSRGLTVDNRPPAIYLPTEESPFVFRTPSLLGGK